MLLRWIVSNYLRQAAEDTVRGAAAEIISPQARQSAGDAADTDGPSGCDAAVLFALPIESGGLVDQLKDLRTARCGSFVEHSGLVAGRQIVVAETGVGGQAAAKAAADILAFHQPRWLISAGFAGGLTDEIRPGHLVLADKIGNRGSETLSIGLPCDREWIAQARGVHAGKLLTLDEIVRTEADKRRAAERHGAIACDMESFAIAEVCRDRQTPMLSIRIVTDAVDDTLPAEIDRLMRQTSLAGKLGAAAGAVFKRPSAAKELWDLRGTALKASDRLAKFLVSMLAQLPATGD